MRIQASDLTDYLHQHFPLTFCIVGEEPLQQKEALDTVRRTLQKKGYADRKRFDITPNFDWPQFESNFFILSLFSEKRCIECHIDAKLNKTALEKLTTLLEARPVDLAFILIIKYWDAALLKTRLFLKLEAKGTVILSRPLKGGAMKLFCQKRGADLGLTFNPAVINTLVERTEGNLLATANVLEKLKLCHLNGDPNITREDILEMTHFNARFSLYDLTECIFSGNASKIIEILQALEEDSIEPILVLWVLTKEIRTCIAMLQALKKEKTMYDVMQEFYVFRHRIPVLTNFLKKRSLSSLYALLLEAKTLDAGMKGVTFQDTWSGLLALCLKFCGDCHG